MNKKALVTFTWIFVIVGMCAAIFVGFDSQDDSKKKDCSAAGGVRIKSQEDKILCVKMDVISTEK